MNIKNASNFTVLGALEVDSSRARVCVCVSVAGLFYEFLMCLLFQGGMLYNV